MATKMLHFRAEPCVKLCRNSLAKLFRVLRRVSSLPGNIVAAIRFLYQLRHTFEAVNLRTAENDHKLELALNELAETAEFLTRNHVRSPVSIRQKVYNIRAPRQDLTPLEIQSIKTEKTIVYMPYFTAPTEERQKELDLCVQKNVENEFIDLVILLIDDFAVPPIESDKIDVITVDGRPTYRLWIELAKRQGPNKLAILCNSDIYFDQSIKILSKLVSVAPPVFVALSRYELMGDESSLHPNPHWSQDTWALNTSAEIPESLLKGLDIPLGVPRCDNKVAYYFAVHGWTLSNPCHCVRSIHVHNSGLRSYDKKLDRSILGAVGYVHPSLNTNMPAKVSIDIWAVGASAIQNVTLNTSLDKWLAEQASMLTSIASVANGIKVGIESNKKNTISIQSNVNSADESFEINLMRLLREGSVVYDYYRRFRIYRIDDELLSYDHLAPHRARKLNIHDLLPGASVKTPLNKDLIATFIPAVIDAHPLTIGDRPISREDYHFWQYPCATEKQAYENHLEIKPGQNVDAENRTIHTYVGLPWATYIDRQSYPDDISVILRQQIGGLKMLAEANGYALAVHTVVQHIKWSRFMEHFQNLGITDLHISHYDTSIEPQRDNYQFRIHSWPLIAVNYVDPTRSRGLVISKPISDKQYLASFIGAHMSHYRSDVRLRLLEAAQRDGAKDILVDLCDEWHFQKTVYEEQVLNKITSNKYLKKLNAATIRYNEVLSNSVFSLCPEGSGPNTLRIWESLAVGSIPVILSDDWIQPKLRHSQIDLADCCIFYPQEKLDALFHYLRSISQEEVEAMKNNCIGVYKEFSNMITYNHMLIQSSTDYYSPSNYIPRSEFRIAQ